MSDTSPEPTRAPEHAPADDHGQAVADATRDIADVPAVEVITTASVHLMSAAAVKVGLADDPESQTDLDEARKLMTQTLGALSPLGLLAEDWAPGEGRLWGNFPQAYSHVGLIHGAFAASPPWSEVI